MCATGPLRLSRRGFLAGTALVALPWALGQTARAAEVPEGAPFSFDILTAEMQARAAQPYAPPERAGSPWAEMTYDDWRHIAFRREATRWSDAGLFRLQAFHPGWLHAEPVRLYDVSSGTVAALPFGRQDFHYGPALFADGGGLRGTDPAIPSPGVAGFRLLYPLNRPDAFDEVTAFLGASYFRALGAGNAYGLSARGLALNTANGEPEEFPRFAAFYLERPAPDAAEVALSAALDGPSVTGAFRFVIRPGGTTVMEVTARLFFRADVAQVGVAPLTSMFLYDEKNRAGFDDYRPRVHDSNGLRVVAGGGEAIWRPLNNPAAAVANSYFMGAPRRFGLHQRGRDGRDYQDAEAHYERRPSLEVEPLDDWGAGAVRLVEIPTDREVNDNIVAFFAPARSAKAGDAQVWRYRLHWGDLIDEAPDRLAQVVSFKAGLAGVSGVENPADARKFVIDFAGPPLDALPDDAALEAAVTLSAGEVLAQVLERVPEFGVWRLVLDIAAPGVPLVELTAHLAGFGRRLTETWAYQWVHAG